MIPAAFSVREPGGLAPCFPFNRLIFSVRKLKLVNHRELIMEFIDG